MVIFISMNQPIHILNQMGVMTSFSVAKKITEEDINKYFSKYKRSGKNEKQIGDMLKEKILDDIDNAVKKNQIPGILQTEELANSLGIDKNVIKKMPELNRLIMIISHKIAEKKYDKMSLCYFINSLVNVFGLSEDDFTKFHQQNGTSDDDDDDDNDKAF
jgi:hypothetical protein